MTFCIMTLCTTILSTMTLSITKLSMINLRITKLCITKHSIIKLSITKLCCKCYCSLSQPQILAVKVGTSDDQAHLPSQFTHLSCWPGQGNLTKGEGLVVELTYLY